MANPPPTVDYATASSDRRRRNWITAGVIIASLVAAATFIGWVSRQPILRSNGGFPPRAKCASNLHQIGLGIILFCNEHGGHYPDSLAAIISNQSLSSECLTCPSTNDTVAQIAGATLTTQQVAAQLAPPGHVSYVYVGNVNWTDALPNDAIVVYEPTSNHGGQGSNFLFGDGHSEWIDTPRADRLIKAAAATTQPVSASSIP